MHHSSRSPFVGFPARWVVLRAVRMHDTSCFLVFLARMTLKSNYGAYSRGEVSHKGRSNNAGQLFSWSERSALTE